MVSSPLDNAIAEAGRFAAKPSGSSIFRIFDQLVDQRQVWYPALLSINLSPLERALCNFERALAEGEEDDVIARLVLRFSLSADTNREGALAARVLCAARAMLIYKKKALADKILLRNRPVESASREDGLVAFFLRVRCRINDEQTARLFRVLLDKKVSGCDEAAKEWIKLKWRYEGPDNNLLAEAVGLSKELGAIKVAREAIACAFRIGEDDEVQRLLHSFPKLLASYDAILPLAAYIVQSPQYGHKLDRQTLLRYADLYGIIRENSKELDRVLSNPGAAIGVVGNSPCEIGRGRGGQIDSHDYVVRCNYFSVAPQFKVDYGEKYDIHVRGPKNDPELNHRTLEARYAVLAQFDFMYQPRKWVHFLELSERGAKLCCLPAGAHRPLQARLNVEPSLGLAFLAHLAALRGGQINRQSCFGFAFTDQIGENPTSAHYFESARPALTHNWEGEARIFAELAPH